MKLSANIISLEVVSTLSVICLLATGHVRALRCLEGQQRGDTEQIGSLREVQCGFSQTTCLTRLEINRNQKFISRSCKSGDACMTQEAGNEFHCYAGDNKRKMHRVCHYCCSTDLCNNFTMIQPPPGK